MIHHPNGYKLQYKLLYKCIWRCLESADMRGLAALIGDLVSLEQQMDEPSPRSFSWLCDHVSHAIIYYRLSAKTHRTQTDRQKMDRVL